MISTPRIIPVLLYHNNGLVKTKKFGKPTYIGDPLNTIKIFNEKEVDELVLFDIDASSQKRDPDWTFLKQFAQESFIPLNYGGGISNLDQIKKIIQIGFEKVTLNSTIFDNPNLIKNAASRFGSSTIVVCIDYKKNFLGKHVFSHNGKVNQNITVLDYVKKVNDEGAGEIILQSINNDGMYTGYDLDLIQSVASTIDIPVIACGGAANIDDFKKAEQIGASAMAAGSLFVFYGKHKAVLINYPNQKERKEKNI